MSARQEVQFNSMTGAFADEQGGPPPVIRLDFRKTVLFRASNIHPKPGVRRTSVA